MDGLGKNILGRVERNGKRGDIRKTGLRRSKRLQEQPQSTIG